MGYRNWRSSIASESFPALHKVTEKQIKVGTVARARFTDGNIPNEVMNVKNANPERGMPLVPNQVLKTSGLVTQSSAEDTQIIPHFGF